WLAIGVRLQRFVVLRASRTGVGEWLVDDSEAVDTDPQAAGAAVVPLDEALELVGIPDAAAGVAAEPALEQLDAIALLRDHGASPISVQVSIGQAGHLSLNDASGCRNWRGGWRASASRRVEARRLIRRRTVTAWRLGQCRRRERSQRPTPAA